MEYSAFRDYCKAENSEDEDVNRDLQSRLYAEVYYTPNDADNKNTKSNIKLETYTDNENLYNDASASKVSGPNDNFINSSTDKNYKNTCPLNDFTNSSVYTENDDKSSIEPICIANKIELPGKDTNKTVNSNVPCTKALKYSEDNVKDSRNNKDLTICSNLKSAETYSDSHETFNIQDMKPQIGVENIQVKIRQCLNYETTSDHSFHLNCVKQDADNNTDNNRTLTRTETIVNIAYDNIFKKYEFSKLFINKLYLEKYETLEKRLQRIEADKEKNFPNKECMTADVKVANRNHQQEMSDNYVKSANYSELDTKYKVFSKAAKARKPPHHFADIRTLALETSSDSEESILEVPIPPKPEPPVINLKDSDESSGASSICSDTDQEHVFNRKEKNDLSVVMEKKTSMVDQDSDSKISDINSADDATITEDIMLNCTEIRRAASSVKEIMDTSKTVHLAQYADNDKSDYEKKQSILENEIYSKCFNEPTYDKHNMPMVNVPSKTINDSSVIHERDKDESIDFTEDVMVSYFTNTNKTIESKKRRYKSDTEPSTSLEHGRCVDNDSKRSKLDLQQNTENEIHQELGQENFDMQRIQSNMSKDPRLWVILDEDLMPNLMKRQRYWNGKCKKCHQLGHLRHKCPEPHKPVTCHICGTQGHIETRCPQKMCLTCGKKQQIFRQTCESCRTLYCDMCKAIGHKSTECPDHWRRFHQTTQMTEIHVPENLSEVMKPADLLYCCNCSRRGHDSSTCHEYRWSQHFPTPAFVSNYTDGPACEVQAHCGNITDDVIPLTKLKKEKMKIFPKGSDNLDSDSVIYSYGTFHTNIANGKEIIRKLAGVQVKQVHVRNVVNGHISPCFLDDLTKKINFEIKIFYCNSKDLAIRVRSTVDACRSIFQLFIFWLKLDDTDKHLRIRIDFPWKTKLLHKLLERKDKELHRTAADPRKIYKEIKQLKTSMPGVQNATTSISERILHLQSILIKVYHTKPKLTPAAVKFRDIIKKLRKISREYVNLRLYLDTVVAYNKVFVPRTLNDVKIDCFLKEYAKKVKSDLFEKKAKARQKYMVERELDAPYLKFIRSLNDNKQNSNSYSSNNSGRRKMEVPPMTSTSLECISASNSNTDTAIMTQHTVPVSNETLNVGNSATKPTDVNCSKRIELPCNKEISSTKKIISAENNRKLTTLSNVITREKSIHSNVATSQSNTDHSPSVSSAQTKDSTDNIENDLEIIDYDTAALKMSNLNKINTVDSESNVSKKKKNRKTKKAKLEIHDNSDVIEIDIDEIDTSMKDQANQIMEVALNFNVPYMNKAVEEIKKKLNDKTIKQEHIDTLQRLINLENDHRKYVSSFCNYLQ